jgi:hypothetical protein
MDKNSLTLEDISALDLMSQDKVQIIYKEMSKFEGDLRAMPVTLERFAKWLQLDSKFDPQQEKFIQNVQATQYQFDPAPYVAEIVEAAQKQQVNLVDVMISFESYENLMLTIDSI